MVSANETEWKSVEKIINVVKRKKRKEKIWENIRSETQLMMWENVGGDRVGGDREANDTEMDRKHEVMRWRVWSYEVKDMLWGGECEVMKRVWGYEVIRLKVWEYEVESMRLCGWKYEVRLKVWGHEIESMRLGGEYEVMRWRVWVYEVESMMWDG